MTRFYSLILSATLLGAAPVAAQVPLGGIVTGGDIDRIAEILGAYGTAERRQGEHSPWIRAETDGIVYSVTFLNCDDAGSNCTTVQFRAWWESHGAHSLEAMNQWNRDRRFSAAYLDADMDATIEWDVNLAGGVTAVNFDDNVQWWLSVVREFREQVIQPGYDEAAPQGSK
ncbi:MAG: YbjN domain-containing protein [Rhodobacteraceae bacterium]|nr:YbjN domain-containing protein [Paracoccaceae bacterium]